MSAPKEFESIDMPTFPLSTSIPFAEPGTYQLLAFIDADGSGLMATSEGDPTVVQEITLPTAETIVLNFDGGAPNPSDAMPSTGDTGTAEPPAANPNQQTKINVTVNFSGLNG